MTLRDVPSRGRGGRRTRALLLALSGVLVLGACASPAQEAEAPARAVLSAAETEESTAPPEVNPGDAQIDPTPSGGETPSAGQPWDEAASAACRELVGPALSQVAQSADDAGVTTFWATADSWAVCDMAEGVPTLVAAAETAGGFDETSLSLTSTPAADDSGARHVAAGLLPWPVQELAYTFPDQHTERARFVSSEGDPDQVWWVVSYTASEGPLARADVEGAGLGPVTVSVVDGAAEAFRFDWDELQRSE